MVSPVRSSDDRDVAAPPRTYRFTLSFEVEADHPAYDDPEWAADAAWGALTHEYGLSAAYMDIEELDVTIHRETSE